MRSIQSLQSFPLSSVKPLEGLIRYRDFCLDAVKRDQADKTTRRQHSPIDQKPLVHAGQVGDIEYLRCGATGSLFMAELPTPAKWSALL